MPPTVEETEVVVVGGGPVGLTAAASLNHHGVKTTLVEKKTTTSSLTKAQFLSGRSVEHFRQIGIENVIQDASWPRDVPPTIRVCNQILNSSTLLSIKLSSWGDMVEGKSGCKFIFYQEGMSVSPPLLCPQT